MQKILMKDADFSKTIRNHRCPMLATREKRSKLKAKAKFLNKREKDRTGIVYN